MTLHLTDSTLAELLANESFMKEYREWVMSPVAVSLLRALVPFMSPRPRFESDRDINYAAVHNFCSGGFFAIELLFGLDRMAKKVLRNVDGDQAYGVYDLMRDEFGFADSKIREREKGIGPQ